MRNSHTQGEAVTEIFTERAKFTFNSFAIFYSLNFQRI